MTAWIRAFESLALGSHCLICSVQPPLPRRGVCEACWLELPWRHDPQIRLAAGSGFAIEGLASLRYEGVAQDLVFALKYGGRRAAAIPLAECLGQIFEHCPTSLDCLVPVPTFWLKRWSRGIHHTQVLAELVGHRQGLPVLGDRLVRHRATVAMGQLHSFSQRRQALVGAFSVRPLRRWLGARIGLVDDVGTTGATTQQCTHALLAAGSGPVTPLLVASSV